MALSITRCAIVLGVFAGGVMLTVVGCNVAQKEGSTTQASTKPAWWQPAPDNRSGAEIWRRPVRTVITCARRRRMVPISGRWRCMTCGCARI